MVRRGSRVCGSRRRDGAFGGCLRCVGERWARELRIVRAGAGRDRTGPRGSERLCGPGFAARADRRVCVGAAARHGGLFDCCALVWPAPGPCRGRRRV
eukprot:7388003-Prymnesium_polylepis.1